MVFFETHFFVHPLLSSLRRRLLLREVTRVITERDGAVLRIVDLGWRNSAIPIEKPRVGVFFYGRWYNIVWGGHPSVEAELRTTFRHNTGILRHITEKIKSPQKMYRPRKTFYPMLGSMTPPLTHHIPHRTVRD